MEDSIIEIVENLIVLEKDSSIPKNVKTRIKGAMGILADEKENISLRIDKSLEALGDICEDPNLPSYVKMQLWSIVSQLESK